MYTDNNDNVYDIVVGSNCPQLHYLILEWTEFHCFFNLLLHNYYSEQLLWFHSQTITLAAVLKAKCFLLKIAKFKCR